MLNAITNLINTDQCLHTNSQQHSEYVKRQNAIDARKYSAVSGIPKIGSIGLRTKSSKKAVNKAPKASSKKRYLGFSSNKSTNTAILFIISLLHILASAATNFWFSSSVPTVIRRQSLQRVIVDLSRTTIPAVISC